MGWFFGCFGGKKGRKHGTSSGISNAKHKKSEPFPTRSVSGRLNTSAPISSKATVNEASNRQDLFKVRQVTSVASGSVSCSKREPIKQNSSPLHLQVRGSTPLPKPLEGHILHTPTFNSASEDKLSVKKPLPNPWSQVDELEEELEDLRRKLTEESEEAKKLRDEVKYLRSCGTLPKTPPEIKNGASSLDKSPDKAQSSWHSWLPPVSPICKIQLNKKFENGGVRGHLCAPTPATECHDLLQGCPTPVCEGSQNGNADGTGRQVVADMDQHCDGPKDIENEAADLTESKQPTRSSKDIESSSHEGSRLLESVTDPSMDSQEFFEISGSSLKRDDISLLFKETDPPGSLQSLDCKMIARAPSGSSFLEEVSGQCLSSSASVLRSSDGKASITNHAVGSIATDTTKKRRILGPEFQENPLKTLDQLSWDSKANASAEAKERPMVDSTSCTQKRQKTLPESPLKRTLEKDRDGASEKHGIVHAIESSQGPLHHPVLQSKLLLKQESHSCLNVRRSSTGGEIQECLQSNCMYIASRITVATQERVGGKNFSVRQQEDTGKASNPESASQSQSISFATSASSHESHSMSFTGDEKIASGDAFSRGSYSNSYSYDESSEATVSPTDSYVGSEESGSDVGPARCLSPPSSPGGRHNACGDDDECDSELTISDEVDKYGSRLAPNFKRSSFERLDSTEDDIDLFSDAASHVSTECSVEKESVRHGRTDSLDSLGTDTSYYSRETPLKVSSLMQTPAAAVRTLANKNARLRSQCSVLTPVENLSQWKQLKEKTSSSKQSPVTRLSKSSIEKQNDNFSTAVKASSPAGKPKIVARALELYSEVHCGSKNIGASDASISRATFQDARAPESSDVIRVDTSLSHWLKPSPSSQEKSQSPASSKTEENSSRLEQTPSPSSPAVPSHIETPVTWVRSRVSPKAAEERPILGTVPAHWSDLSAVKKWWDGKGIPNTTTKYKEDQKVSWHTTPFEVRLDRALAKQGLIFQK